MYFKSDSGTRVAFEDMYRKYSSTVYLKICQSICDTHLRNDVLQEIFVKFYKSMRRLKNEDEARKWLMTIAHNEIINHGREAEVYNKHAVFDLSEEELLETYASTVGDSVFERLSRREMCAEVRKKIQSLSPKLQEVITLKYYFGYTSKEIAGIVDCPLSTVYSRLTKAREVLYTLLYDIMNEYCGKGDIDGER